MRFAISLLAFRPGRLGGAETYVRQLLAHLPGVAGADEIVAVMDRDVARGLETPGCRRVVVPRSARRLVADRILEAYTPWRARAVERLIQGIGANAMLFPQQSVFPKRAPVRAVLTAVDVQHLFHPENFGLFDRTFRPAIYPRSMARSERIIAISEFTRKTLIERCGLAPARVTAIPFGLTPGNATAVPTERVQGPYLYYPAATFPHKDHLTLIRTYALLHERGALREKLVFTGLQTGHWRTLRKTIDELGISADVVHLGFLPFAEVRRVYAGASAVLFPTRFEGFGLPVLEAAELGKKVITSRLEIFDEIGVPKRFQIDFADPAQLLAALSLEGPTALEKTPWGWRDCAAATLDVLRGAATSTSGDRP